MKILQTEKTKQTPGILFNGETGVLEISGRSIPENTSVRADRSQK